MINMAHKEGFVYIFINDSFRDGWVKIGKTQDIKRRLKDLDNTSCPLPFKVYATMKTSKYNEAEELVQEFIAHFNSDLRVRPNREYFKVSPEEALKIFYQVQKVIDDAEIDVFGDAAKECKKPKKEPQIATNLIPCFMTRNCNANALFNVDTEEVTLLKGSSVNPYHLPNRKGTALETRLSMIGEYTEKKGDKLITTSDIQFKSPSAATKFCVGGSADGWYSWKNKEGEFIHIYRKK